MWTNTSPIIEFDIPKTPRVLAIGSRIAWNGIKHPNSKKRKTHWSPLNLHFVKTYPVIAPINVEKNTAGTETGGKHASANQESSKALSAGINLMINEPLGCSYLYLYNL